MAIDEICNRDVVFARGEAPVKAAAQLMREYHTGSIVVAGKPYRKCVPAGIVTGRTSRPH